MKIRLKYWRGRVNRILCLLAFGFAVSNSGWAQFAAIKNNLLYDATLTPNLGIEARVNHRWSVGVNAGLNAWDMGKNGDRKWRHLMVSPYTRFWVSDSTFARHFIGMHAVYSHYNVGNIHLPFGIYKSLRHERRQGDLFAIGLSYGYHWRLSDHWHMEAEIGGAVAYTQYDKYECGRCGKILGTEDKIFFLPKLGLNVGYYLGRTKVEEPVEEEVPVQIVDTVPAEKVVFRPAFRPVVPVVAAATRLQPENPVLQPMANYRPYDRTRVLRKEPGALFVHYNYDTDLLEPPYRDNAQTLDRIVNITRQVLTDSMSLVRKIQIVGLSSIEGPVDYNERLSGLRGQSLKRYVQEQTGAPDSLFEVSAGGEAWAELRDQLQDELPSDSAAIMAALAVIDHEPNQTTRERRLRRINGGRLYKYIHTELLPEQRNAGYLRIFYDAVPDLNAQNINRASELLSQQRYADALPLLQQMKDDPRAWNALGVALYMTGQHDAGLEYFRRAAQNGNIDARDNLEMLKTIKQ